MKSLILDELIEVEISLRNLQERREQLRDQLGIRSKPAKKRKLSAEAVKSISEAQRKRWAEVHAAQKPKAKKPVVKMKRTVAQQKAIDERIRHMNAVRLAKMHHKVA